MCMSCKCEDVIPSTTTHVVNYETCVIVIKNVPCMACVQCGEKYYFNEVALTLEKIVNHAKAMFQDVSVIGYNKVA